MSTDRVRLGDVCKLINGGNWTSDEYAEDGIPVVRVSDMKNGTVDVSDLKHLEESQYERYKKHELKEGDLVLATVGSHKTSSSAAGRATIIPDYVEGMLLNQNAVCLRTDSDKLDQKYLCYLGKSPAFQSYLQTMGKGAANQMRIALSAIRDYEFELPSPQEQERISEILSAYDDLIRVNRERIEQLSRAAHLLFREWFVYYRFPGHEHTEIVDSVPEDWDKVPFDELLANHIGGGWGQEDPQGDENIPTHVIRGTDIPSTRMGHWDEVPLRFLKRTKLRSRNLEPGDIIFEVSGGSANQPVGRSLIVTDDFLGAFEEPVICASFCKRMTPKNFEGLPFYIYHFIKWARSSGHLTIYQKDSASSLQNFNWKDFLSNQMMVIPPKNLLADFANTASKLYREQILLARQNRNLERARDTLLPRLMSGEITV